MDIILKKDTRKIDSRYDTIVKAAKIGSLTIASLNVALAKADHGHFMLAAATASALPTQLQTVIGNIYQLFPGIVIVAFIGFVGVIFRGRTDRGISREQGNIKVFESIIKDNDALRAKNDKLNTDMNELSRKNSVLEVKNTNLENKIATQNEELTRLRADGVVSSKIVANKEKEIIRLRDGRLQDKLEDLGITKEQLAILLQREGEQP